MTRSDLVTQLAERFAQLTQRDTEFAVKTILDAMSDALGRGHRIEIRGLAALRSIAGRRVSGAIRAARANDEFPRSWCPISDPGKRFARPWKRAPSVIDDPGRLTALALAPGSGRP
jgi:integration host factor subunit beta